MAAGRFSRQEEGLDSHLLPALVAYRFVVSVWAEYRLVVSESVVSVLVASSSVVHIFAAYALALPAPLRHQLA